tara:strand:+ start:264 stop:566 length:303 start_codon:yes stop_codon:yes gene_type:complete
MKYNVGDLVLIISSQDTSILYSPPALVLSAYKDTPRIFLYNDTENKRWLEKEDIEVQWVYDIVHLGNVERGISGEWLCSWSECATVESIPAITSSCKLIK